MDRSGRDMQVLAADRPILRPQLSAILGLSVTLHTGGVTGSIPVAPTMALPPWLDIIFPGIDLFIQRTLILCA